MCPRSLSFQTGSQVTTARPPPVTAAATATRARALAPDPGRMKKSEIPKIRVKMVKVERAIA